MGQVSHNFSTTSHRGVGSRAGCGCCLLGPLGALLGGLTAPSRTKEHTFKNTGTLDSGIMVFTNKRFIFIGNKTTNSLVYNKVLSIDFNRIYSGTNLFIKYPEMAIGEYYHLSGPDAQIAEAWYQGAKIKK